MAEERVEQLVRAFRERSQAWSHAVRAVPVERGLARIHAFSRAGLPDGLVLTWSTGEVGCGQICPERGFEVWEERQALAGFDPAWDDVVGIYVRPWRWGSGWELLVAVRRGGDSRLYRAMIVEVAGGLAVRPERVGAVVGDGWQPLGEEALVTAVHRLPYTPGRPLAPARERWDSQEDAVRLTAATWTGVSWVWGDEAGRIDAVGKALTRRLVAWLGHPIRALLAASMTRVVVATSEPALVGLELDLDDAVGFRERWRHPLRFEPAGLALWPATLAGPDAGAALWPPLLLASREGWMSALRYTGGGSSEETWEKAAAGADDEILLHAAAQGKVGAAAAAAARVHQVLADPQASLDEAATTVAAPPYVAGAGRLGEYVAQRLAACRESGAQDLRVLDLTWALYERHGFLFRYAIDEEIRRWKTDPGSIALSCLRDRAVQGAWSAGVRGRDPGLLADQFRLNAYSLEDLSAAPAAAPGAVRVGARVLVNAGERWRLRGQEYEPLSFDEEGIHVGEFERRPRGAFLCALPRPGWVIAAEEGATALWGPDGARAPFPGRAGGQTTAACALGFDAAGGWVVSSVCTGRASRLVLHRCDATDVGLTPRYIAEWNVSIPGLSQLVAVEGGRVFQLYLASSLTSRIDLVRLDPAAPLFERLVSLQVESGVTALHVAPMQRERFLFVGTVEGLVWAFRHASRSSAWSFRVRYEVVSIDSHERDGRFELLVGARRDCVVLLDDAGRRLWRQRTRGTVAGAAFTPTVDGEDRLLVWTTDGGLELYRRSGAPPQEAPDETPSVQVVAALARRDFLAAFPGREPRRLLLEAVAKDPTVDLSTWKALAFAGTYRDLATLARALVHPAPSGRVDTLRDALADRSAVGMHGDDSGRARDAAWAELFRALAREGASMDYLRGAVRDVPAAALADRWVALEVARAWARAAQDASEEGLRAALQTIDALPSAAGPFLPLLLPLESAPAFLAALARLAGDGPDVDLVQRLPDVVALLPAAPTGKAADPYRPWRVAAALLRAEPRSAWQTALDVIRASREAEYAARHELDQAVRALGPRVGASIPEETWPLDQQIAWIRNALSRGLDLGDPTDTPFQWKQLARSLARALAQAFRQAALGRLTTLVGLTRARLEVQRRAWAAPSLLDLDLRLVPEGQRTIHGVKVTVGVVELRSTGRKLERAAAWTQLDGGCGAVPIRFRAVCPPEVTRVTIEVNLTAQDQEPYGYQVTLSPPPRVGGAAPVGRFDAVLDRAAAALGQIKGGVHLVALDPALDPDLLLQQIFRRGGSRVVDVDHAARLLGPDRPGPGNLSLAALVSVLNGKDTPGVNDGSATLQQPDERLVVHGLSDTVARLSDESFARVRDDVVGFLRRHAEVGATPALLLVAPSEECAVLRRLLGDHAGWTHPARVTPGSPDEADVLSAIATRLGGFRRSVSQVGSGAADLLLREACGDLRVLGPALELEPPTVKREWVLAAARADLRALEPNTLLALVYLSGARTQLSAARLVPGVVPDETIEVPMARAGSNPRPIERGVPLRRVPRQQDLGRAAVWVRGWADDVTGAVVSARSGLARAVRGLPTEIERLVALGFALTTGPVTRIRQLYAVAVEEALREGLAEGIRALAGADAVWDALTLADLAGLDEAAQRYLFGPGVGGLARTRQRFGEAWRDGDLPKRGTEEALTALVGAPVSPARRSLSGLADPLVGCRLYEVEAREATTAAGAVLVWVPRGAPAPDPEGVARVGRVLDHSLGTPQLRIALGPGSQGWVASDLGLIVLSDADVRRALRPGGGPPQFWAGVRGRARADLQSPFRSSGALPPGSPLFVGREDVIAPILRDVTNANFLIVGPRQVGKTSLLNRLLFELRRRSDVKPIFLDAQGVRTRAQLAARLPGNPPDAIAALQRDAAASAVDRRQLVVLINEVDGLLESDPEVVAALRGLAEGSGVRFLLVGYYTAEAALRSLTSALYHFTRGPEGQRAFNLSAFSQDAALDLIDRLTAPPLSFAWATDSDRIRGRELLLRRSYRIPWLVQHLCDALCKRLHERRDGLLYRSDVEAVVDEGNPLGKYITELDLGEVAGKKGDALYATTARFLLTAQAWAAYFEAERRVDLPHLDQRDPAQWSFDAGEVVESALRVLARLPVSPGEREALTRFLVAFPTNLVMGGMCLTILLRRVSAGIEARYCFEGHIYPQELARLEASPRGKSPLEQCLDLVQALLPLLPPEVKP